jgi:hypothetical protein
VIGVEAPLGQQLLEVPVRQGKTQIPTKRQKMTSGSNCLHLNRPETDDARSIGPDISDYSCKVATLPILAYTDK